VLTASTIERSVSEICSRSWRMKGSCSLICPAA
jgi:hypothetical protein